MFQLDKRYWRQWDPWRCVTWGIEFACQGHCRCEHIPFSFARSILDHRMNWSIGSHPYPTVILPLWSCGAECYPPSFHVSMWLWICWYVLMSRGLINELDLWMDKQNKNREKARRWGGDQMDISKDSHLDREKNIEVVELRCFDLNMVGIFSWVYHTVEGRYLWENERPLSFNAD